VTGEKEKVYYVTEKDFFMRTRRGSAVWTTSCCEKNTLWILSLWIWNKNEW